MPQSLLLESLLTRDLRHRCRNRAAQSANDDYECCLKRLDIWKTLLGFRTGLILDLISDSSEEQCDPSPIVHKYSRMQWGVGTVEFCYKNDGESLLKCNKPMPCRDSKKVEEHD